MLSNKYIKKENADFQFLLNVMKKIVTATFLIIFVLNSLSCGGGNKNNGEDPLDRWISRDSGITASLYLKDVSYGNGSFVIVGDGIILQSGSLVE
jgi:hypothetical protein